MIRRIFDLDNWREIVATLSRNKTRTFLTAFGIFWGTAMLALLTGGASGLRGVLSRNFDGFATNMGVIFPGHRTLSYKGFNKGTEVVLNMRDITLIRQKVPELDASTPMVNFYDKVRYKDASESMSMLGVEADYFRIMLPVLYSGRLLSENDVRDNARICLIGRDAATNIFKGEDPVGKYVNAGGVYLKVVGVVGQLAEEVNMGGRMDESIIMPYSTMVRAFNLGDTVYTFTYTLKSGHRIADVKEQLMRYIRMNHPIHPDDTQAVFFWDISEMFEMVENVFLAISLLALFVGGGTLIAGIIGVGNIMWIIVKERTQEIGIRRAIGARPIDIIIQILSEGLMLTIVAGLAGIVFAVIILGIVDHLLFDPIHGAPGFVLAFYKGVMIMVTFIILGTAAGFIPAFKAMKIKPIEALNDK